MLSFSQRKRKAKRSSGPDCYALQSTPTLMREWNWLAVPLCPDYKQYCRYGRYESCDTTIYFLWTLLFVSLIGLGAQLKWTGDS
jgi:hypothetical protein